MTQKARDPHSQAARETFSLEELDQALAEETRPLLAPTGPWARVRRWLKWSAYALLALVLLGAAAVALVIHHFESSLPSVEQLRGGYHPPQVTEVLARDGASLATLFTERRTLVPLSAVPDHTKLAFLAAEDASFYVHEGLDYFGMLRALLANLRAGRKRQGGSTITQQVVKNVLLEPERTYARKIRETILARRLEQHLSKDEIFSLYLNHIYFGHRRYGIEEAARYYFGKKSAELDLAESAVLAGIVAAPEHFTPRKYPERALEKRAYVLTQMRDKGFVTDELYQYASARPLRLAPEIEAESDLAPEIIGIAKRSLEEAVGSEAERGGFVVQTTLDAQLQAAARAALRQNLERYLERHKLVPPFSAKKRQLWGETFKGQPALNKIYVGVVTEANDGSGELVVRVGDVLGRVNLRREARYNPKNLLPSKFAEVGAALRVSVQEEAGPSGRAELALELGPQSALVAIDVQTRNVVALIGSYEALVGGLNRALNSRRQPGSAFKPFVYSYALQSQRFTTASLFDVAAKKPEERRKLSLRQGIAESNNEVVQAVFREVGGDNVVQWAHALGIESELRPTESLALGAYEVTPLEIANAYATFASGGEVGPVHLVAHVLEAGGKERALPAPPPLRRVMSPEVAYLTTSLLSSVVEQGTAKTARSLQRPVAGKTGTTNRARDAWFVGYSTDFVAAVWVGYDDNLPLGPAESGSLTALPAWVDFMKHAHEGRPVTEFSRPSGIVVVPIDPATGLLPPVEPAEGQPAAVEEEFLDGTVPSEHAQPQVADAGVADAAAPAPEGQVEVDAGRVPAGSSEGDARSGEPASNGTELPVDPPPF